MKLKFHLFILIACTFLTNHSIAHGKNHTSDNAQIEYLLKEQFDRPEAPLVVAPIVIDGNHAVAGWAQDGKGGRAYLSKGKDGWMVRMCSGESLTVNKTYESLGVSSTQASKLTSILLKEEEKMGSNTSELFSSFEGTILLDGTQDHGAHHDTSSAKTAHQHHEEGHSNSH